MKTALLNICLAAVGVSLLKMIIPDKSFKRQINFLISCFFIAGAILAFTNGKFSFPEITDSTGSVYIDFTEQATADRKRRIAEEMSERIKAVLGAEGISPEEIYIIVNISQYNSISINEIKLVLSSDDDYQRASDAVLREVGGEIKLSIEI